MAIEEELLTEILGVRVVSTDSGLRFESTDESGPGTVTIPPDQFTRLQDAHRKSRQGRATAFGVPLIPDEDRPDLGVMQNEFLSAWPSESSTGERDFFCASNPTGPFSQIGIETRAKSPQAAVNKYTRQLRALFIVVRDALKQVGNEGSPETESTDLPT